MLSMRAGESQYTVRSDERQGYLTADNQQAMMTEAELEGGTARILSNDNAIFAVYQECIKAARGGESSEKKELLQRRVLQKQDFPSDSKQQSSLQSSRPPYYPKNENPGEKLIKHIRKASTTTTRGGEESKSNLTFALDGQQQLDQNSSVNSFDSNQQENYSTPPESVLTPPLPPPPPLQDVFNRQTVRRGSEQVSQIFQVVEAYLKKLNPSVRSHPDTESLLSLISCHNNGGLPQPSRQREEILIQQTPSTPAPLTPSSLQHSRTKRAQPLSPVLLNRNFRRQSEVEGPIFTPRRHSERTENSTPCEVRGNRRQMRNQQRVISTPLNQNEYHLCQERVDPEKVALLESLTRRTKNNIKAYKKLMKQEKKQKTELTQRISALQNLVHQMQTPQLPPLVALQPHQLWRKLFASPSQSQNLSPPDCCSKQTSSENAELPKTSRSINQSSTLSRPDESQELKNINDRLAQQLEANLQTFTELNNALSEREQNLLQKDSAIKEKDTQIIKLKVFLTELQKETERMAAQIQKLCALGKALGFCNQEKYGDMPAVRMDPSLSCSPSQPTQSIKDLSLQVSTMGSNVIPHPRRVEDVSQSSHSPFFKSSTSPFFRSRGGEEVRDSSLVMQMLASPGQSVNTCSGSQMIADFMRSIRQMQRANQSQSCLSSLRLSESAALSQRLARENSLSERNNQITQN